MSSRLADRLAAIREKIVAAARRGGRDPDEIQLIAVSKGQSPERIREVLLAGQSDFGENYQQELSAKATALVNPIIRNAGLETGVILPAPIWHFQGGLQRRKIKEILKFTRSILSVARLEELQEIEKRANQDRKGPRPREPHQVECYVEVNIAREAQKNGVLPENLTGLLDRAAVINNIEIKGLMCVPPFEGDPRPWFAATRELATRNGLRGLSMGMSDDFEIAIEEGATMVRVGTALFGQRD
jgi:hypothetical protein